MRRAGVVYSGRAWVVQEKRAFPGRGWGVGGCVGGAFGSQLRGDMNHLWRDLVMTSE